MKAVLEEMGILRTENKKFFLKSLQISKRIFHEYISNRTGPHNSVVGYLKNLDFDAQIKIMTDSASIFSKESDNGGQQIF